MATPIVGIQDGAQSTVSELLGNPLFIPARILELLSNAFVSQVILRDAGPSNGLVEYEESTPLFLGSDVADVAEFSEIPVAAGSMGLPRIAYGIKQGLGVRASEEMKRKNKIDALNRQITQLVNTMVRADNRALRALLSNPAIPTIAAGAAWDTANGRPRRDLANAMEVVGSSSLSGVTDSDDNLGFMADTTVMSSSLTPVLMDNQNFLDVYKFTGTQEESPAFTGKLPNQVLGMLGLQSRSWPADRVLVVERQTVGFYSDARALEVTPMYPEGNGPNGGPTETWRTDATRERVKGLDQPKAACWITGVKTA